MLAETGWGAEPKTLRIAALGLVYSTAEYGSQLWCNSIHIRKIDAQHNSVVRIISRTVKSSPLQWLLANIKPPHILRKDTLLKTVKKFVDYKRTLLYQTMLQTPN